jgi:hypothetical protein
LRDPDSEIRREAIEVLSRYGPDARPAMPRLNQVALNEEDREVRELAAAVVKALGGFTKGDRSAGESNGAHPADAKHP